MSDTIGFRVVDQRTVEMTVPAQALELLKTLDEIAPPLPAADHGPVATATEEVLAADPLAALEVEQVTAEVQGAVADATFRQDALAAALLDAPTGADTVLVRLRTHQLPDLAAWANRLHLRLRGQQVTVGQGQEVFADADIAALLGQDPAPVTGTRHLEPGEMLAMVPTMLAHGLLAVHLQLTCG